MTRWIERMAAAAGLCLVLLAMPGCLSGGGDDEAAAPVISAQPSSLTVTEGAAATFSVAAEGGEGLSYQWQRDGAPILGATASSLTLPSPGLADTGSRFTVVVQNAAGSVTSATAVLTVSASVAPSIAVQPSGTTVAVGTSAGFSVSADGSGPLTYQWQRDGVDITGATGASYSLASPTLGDSGATFRVAVSNPKGSVMSNAVLLTVAPTVVPPAISAQPQPTSVVDGSTATLSVVASGTGPFAYQWRRNGTPIAGATAASYTTQPLSLADAGTDYSVVVASGAGRVTSANATVTVTPRAVALTSQPANASVAAGQPATFAVAVNGSAPITYQWRRNGIAIAGATAASYTTPATISADNGAAYTVSVSNAAGSVTSGAAVLTVTSATVAPAIGAGPASVAVTAGQAATFTVTASGTSPLSYQWLRNGNAVTGATAASYTTEVTTLADSDARFSVRVSNSAGNVTSSAAVLTVQPSGSVLANRGWTTARSLETDDNSVLDAHSGIADDGKTIVLFRKSNGTRDVIYATVGQPNGIGAAPSWSPPVAIDVLNGTGISTMVSTDYGLVVTPAGHALAYWYHTSACSASTYRITGNCRYYYAARYNAGTGTWATPVLIGDTPSPDFSAVTNDRGDIALVGKGWVRSGRESYDVALTLFTRNPAEAGFRKQLLNSVEFDAYILDLDAAGNLLLAAGAKQNATIDLVALRGTVAAGLGSPIVVDTRGATVGLQQARVGLNGQQVIVWTQSNGTSTVFWAASSDTPSAAFTVQELGDLPVFGDVILTIDDGGDAVVMNRYYRWRVSRVAGQWGQRTSLPTNVPTSVFATCHHARTADFLCASINSSGAGSTGQWATYDARRNVMVKTIGRASSADYVLGVDTIGRSPGFLPPQLSVGGVGFIGLRNRYDVLPSPTAPEGDGRRVFNLWGSYLK